MSLQVSRPSIPETSTILILIQVVCDFYVLLIKSWRTSIGIALAVAPSISVTLVAEQLFGLAVGASAL